MIILGTIGEQGSGKGTVANYLIQNYQADFFRSSMALDEILTILDIPNERKNMTAVSTALREPFGQDFLIHAIKKKIRESKAPVSIVDGLRVPGEIESLRQLENFYLLYITAPIEMRYRNVTGRGEKAGETELTLEEFVAQETDLVTEQKIGEMAKGANFTIENTGTLEELHTKIDATMQEIQG